MVAKAKNIGAIRELLEFKGGPDRVLVTRTNEGKLTAAVLKGVKLLGSVSANRNGDGTQNVYTLEARRGALKLYEGAKVFVDHRKPGELRAPRSVRDHIAVVRDAQAKPDGTYGDVHLSPAHPLTEHVVWAAQNAPRSLGMSHAAQGKGVVDGKRFLVEHIVGVESVDLVSDPATTAGLFEARRPSKSTKKRPTSRPLTSAQEKRMLEEMRREIAALKVKSAKQRITESIRDARDRGELPTSRPRLAPHQAIDVTKYGHASRALAEGKAPRKQLRPHEVVGANLTKYGITRRGR